MKKYPSGISYIKILLLNLLFVFNTYANLIDEPSYEIGEPTYSINDANNVNLASGNLYYNLTDVSIGHGSGTLSHSITINARNAVQLDAYFSGYKDKYRGGIRRTLHSNENNVLPFYVIQVSDEIASYQFVINNGQFINLAQGLETLTVSSGQYILTRADGTKVFFVSPTTIPSSLSTNYSAYGSMIKIEYPNGFIINIHKDGNYISSRIMSVNSNNGLQLKYIYEVHSRPLASSKQSATSDPQILADSLNWSTQHPRRIIAVNNAVEICPLMSNTCTLQNQWPEVNYLWPDGMPRAMYIGTSTFTVQDAFGKNTVFTHYAHDQFEGFGSGLGQHYFPRISQVRTNTGFLVDYVYQNEWIPKFHAPFFWLDAGPKGSLINATQNSITTNYLLYGGGYYVHQNSNERVMSVNGGYKPVNYVKKSALWQSTLNGFSLSNRAFINAPFEVDTWDKTVYLDKTFANNVDRIVNKLDGTTTYFEYDPLGRLYLNDLDGLYQKVVYPHSLYSNCTEKTCHKPSQISNRYRQGVSPVYTYLYYHANSGQLERIKHPANAQNLIAEEYNTYQQYTARYLNASGNLANATSSIWLKQSSFRCKNSNMSGTNCSGNDKVTTTYEYGSGSAGNNLFLLGTTVTTQGESEVRTTCYKYDKYGHQIEVSQPKAGISSCNTNREY